jgi:cytoplasmic iron level regulating protein YaaA (DUF328/UPF0246 family)
MIYKVFLAPTKIINPLATEHQIISIPVLSEEAEYLVNELKTKRVEELSKMMKISIEVARINMDRFKKWRKSTGENEEYHAIQMYAGEAFKAFDYKSLDERFHQKMQATLFILSGLYGVLKPFDLIYPYRLEMGLNYSPSKQHRNLYNYWNEKLVSYFDHQLKKDDVIINLASQEYTKAVDLNKLGRRVITPHFKEFKNGNYTMVMMFAKKARGKMARFIVENEINRDEDLKLYCLDGYSFSESLSTENDWLFIR